jgi:hypothetical protein
MLTRAMPLTPTLLNTECYASPTAGRALAKHYNELSKDRNALGLNHACGSWLLTIFPMSDFGRSSQISIKRGYL